MPVELPSDRGDRAAPEIGRRLAHRHDDDADCAAHEDVHRINRSGHADTVSRKSTDGSTVEKSSAGIVSCIDKEEPLVNVGVITPCAVRAARASVAAINTAAVLQGRWTW